MSQRFPIHGTNGVWCGEYEVHGEGSAKQMLVFARNPHIEDQGLQLVGEVRLEGGRMYLETKARAGVKRSAISMDLQPTPKVENSDWTKDEGQGNPAFKAARAIAENVGASEDEMARILGGFRRDSEIAVPPRPQVQEPDILSFGDRSQGVA